MDETPSRKYRGLGKWYDGKRRSETIVEKRTREASAEMRRLLPSLTKKKVKPPPKYREYTERKLPSLYEFEDTCLPKEGYHVQGCLGHKGR